MPSSNESEERLQAARWAEGLEVRSLEQATNQEKWRQYACVALAAIMRDFQLAASPTSATALAASFADRMLELENKRAL